MKNRFSTASGEWVGPSAGAARHRWDQHAVLAAALVAGLAGDALCVLGVLHAGFRLSHRAMADAETHRALSWLYAGLGTVVFTAAAACHGMYARELLLDRRRQYVYLVEAWFGSCAFFFGVTALFHGVLLPLPRAVWAAFTILIALMGWRALLHGVMRSERVTRLLAQRIVILGWSENTARLARQAWEEFVYPCEIVGYVEIGPKAPASDAPPNIPCLGAGKDLGAILNRHHIDAVFMDVMNVAEEKTFGLARVCQMEMAEFKVIPSGFPALASGMNVEWISGVPILGTDRLRMSRLHVRMEKRALDIAGALAGLLLAGPVIALFAALVYWESPGPVFYWQRRLGRKGMPFDMVKIRSMRPDAEKGGKAGWTVSNDPRRLRVGAFMRRWNIDELPQFWNVLRGEMSLVGPRPERPEFITNLKHEITHYNLRHCVKPGLTGWAQVNGLRGDTDLSERVRHDLFYIDNWSLMLDVRTMFRTLFNHKNAC